MDKLCALRQSKIQILFHAYGKPYELPVTLREVRAIGHLMQLPQECKRPVQNKEEHFLFTITTGEFVFPHSLALFTRLSCQALVSSFEVEARRQETAASRIQGLSRMRVARARARERVFEQFEKRFDVYSGTFYYHSNKSGVDSFAKPRVLRPDQVRTASVVGPRKILL